MNIVKGRLKFFSQRIDGRPYVNCMPYGLCVTLRWMGYDIPDTYGMDIRVASGVPVQPHRGMSFWALKRGLLALLPSAAVTFGRLSEVDLWAILPRPGKRNRKRATVLVGARMEKLPRYYRRLVGYTWEGGHALAVAGYRQVAENGDVEVFILDPMGRTAPPEGAPDDWEPYKGDWILWRDLWPALSKRDGLVRVAYGFKNTAV